MHTFPKKAWHQSTVASIVTLNFNLSKIIRCVLFQHDFRLSQNTVKEKCIECGPLPMCLMMSIVVERICLPLTINVKRLSLGTS